MTEPQRITDAEVIDVTYPGSWFDDPISASDFTELDEKPSGDIRDGKVLGVVYPDGSTDAPRQQRARIEQPSKPLRPGKTIDLQGTNIPVERPGIMLDTYFETGGTAPEDREWSWNPTLLEDLVTQMDARLADPFVQLQQQVDAIGDFVEAIETEKVWRRSVLFSVLGVLACTAWIQLATPLMNIARDHKNIAKQSGKENLVDSVINFLSPDMQRSPKVGEKVGGYVVTSGWGPRNVQGDAAASRYHRGVDVGTPIGTPVHAVGRPGESVTVQCLTDTAGTGGSYSVQTAASLPDLSIEVLHLSKCYPGTYKAGDVIAASGSAGTGPHEHIQIRHLSKKGNDSADCGGISCNGLFPPPVWAVQGVLTGTIPSSLTDRNNPLKGGLNDSKKPQG